MDRRDFLKAAGLVAFGPAWPAAAQDASGTLVNDIHSQLNPIRVSSIVDIDSVTSLQDAVRKAAAEGSSVCVAGGRHAMGGQQFAAGATLLDMRRCSKVLGLDAANGHRRGRSGHHVAGARRGAPAASGRRRRVSGASRRSRPAPIG